jgi:hypothetical protein
MKQTKPSILELRSLSPVFCGRFWAGDDNDRLEGTLTMVGFEVHLNGKRLYTAGVGETGVLTAGISWVVRTVRGVASPAELTLDVGGLSVDDHLNWASPRMLRVGDQVVLTVVDTATPDPPSRTHRDDVPLVEAGERKYYERLKAKYGRSRKQSPGKPRTSGGQTKSPKRSKLRESRRRRTRG